MRPSGVALDSSGNVYVADTGNHRIQKFRTDGSFIRTWGVQCSGNGEFKSPIRVALDSSGDVYVVDTKKHHIQKFESGGTFTTKVGSEGSADGQFRFPSGVAIKSAKVSIQEERVFVVDHFNDRIQVFKPKIVVNP